MTTSQYKLKTQNFAKEPQSFNPDQCRREVSRLTELLGNLHLTPIGDKKRPYKDNWQLEATPIHKIDDELSVGKALGYGLVTGNGLFVLDQDGKDALKLLNDLFEGYTIPDTVSWSSGKEGRRQLLFKIPESYLEHFQGLGKRVIKYDKDDRKSDQLELRYEGHQSVLPPSYHPDTGQTYYWLNSPWDVAIAYLPEPICDRVLGYFNDEKKSKNRNADTSQKPNKGQFKDNSELSQLTNKIVSQLQIEQIFDWSGHNFKYRNQSQLEGFCPQHGGESGTSFVVNLNDATWYCFNCEEGGGAIQYQAFKENGTSKPRGKRYIDILKKLGDRAGINVSDELEHATDRILRFSPDYLIRERFVNNSDLIDQVGSVAIKSSVKSGKTQHIRDKINDGQNVIYAAPRLSLTHNFANSTGIPHINDPLTESCVSIATTLDSIIKIRSSVEETNYELVLDEVELLFDHLICGETTISQRRKQTVTKLKNLAQNAQKVWLLDANLTDITVNFFAQILNVNFTKIENSQKEKLKTVNKIKSKDVQEKILKSAKNDEKLMILVDSLKDAERWRRTLTKYGTTKLVTSEEKDDEFVENPTHYIAQNEVQFLITTNCLSVGFSIENYDYFDAVIASFSHGVDNPKDIIQFLTRLRDFNTPRFVHISNRYLVKDSEKQKQLLYLSENNPYVDEQTFNNIKTYLDYQREEQLHNGLKIIHDRDLIYQEYFALCSWKIIHDFTEKVQDLRQSFNEELSAELPSKRKCNEEKVKDEAEKIINSDDSKWSKNSDKQFYNAQPDEKDHSWKKNHYKRTLDGIEQTEYWTTENIIKLEDGYYQKIKNYWLLQNFDHFQYKTALKLIKEADRGKFYNDIKINRELFIQVLYDVGFLDLIKKGYWYVKDDDTASAIATKLNQHPHGSIIRQYKSFNRTLKEVLEQLGISANRSKVDGNYLYRLHYDDFFSYVLTKVRENSSQNDSQFTNNSNDQYEKGICELREETEPQLQSDLNTAKHNLSKTIQLQNEAVTNQKRWQQQKQKLESYYSDQPLIDRLMDKIQIAEVEADIQGIDEDGKILKVGYQDRTYWVYLDKDLYLIDVQEDGGNNLLQNCPI